MFIHQSIVFLAICVSLSYCLIDPYCTISPDHTMCKYHGIGEDCDDVGGYGVTSVEKKEILDVHNWLRSLIASGHETKGAGGPQPKAADMMKLSWDDELAKVAQRWADQCRFQHDTCRDDERWKVGQNIYWKWRYPEHNVNWTEAIISWYNEVSLFNPKDVKSYRFEAATGHYTQLVWHDTYALGCGRRDYGSNKIYVCNYGPTGNWINEPLYAIGEPCSKCPQKTVCNEYICEYPESAKPPTTTKPETKPIETNTVTQPTKKVESTTHGYTDPSTKGYTETVHYTEKDKIFTKYPNQTHTKEVKPAHKLNLLHYLHFGSNLEKHNQNSVEDELDAETKSGIEEIKIKITKLVKKVLRKAKAHD